LSVQAVLDPDDYDDVFRKKAPNEFFSKLSATQKLILRFKNELPWLEADCGSIHGYFLIKKKV